MTSMTIRPNSIHTSTIEVNPNCVGIIIGRGGKNIQSLIAQHQGIKIKGPKRGDARQVFSVSGASTQEVHAAIANIRHTAAKWEQWRISQMNSDSLRRQATRNARFKRNADIKAGEFTQVRSYPTRIKVTSPGPSIRSRKKVFTFGELDSSSDEEEDEMTMVEPHVKKTPLQGSWAQPLKIDAASVNALPSSPKDDQLLARKRVCQRARNAYEGSSKLQDLVANTNSSFETDEQVKQTTIQRPRRIIDSWADAADDDDSSDEEDDKDDKVDEVNEVTR